MGSRVPEQTIPTSEKSQDNRGVWRFGASDIEDYIAEAYRRTAERIAAGELQDEGGADAE